MKSITYNIYFLIKYFPIVSKVTETLKMNQEYSYTCLKFLKILNES